jgi:AAA ATPase domain
MTPGPSMRIPVADVGPKSKANVLRYLDFQFENFKGIQKMSLDLGHQVTTLIGLNESGKTTILEAIYCFEYGSEDLDAINPDLASVHDYSQWIPIARRANFSDNIKLSTNVALDPKDKQALRTHMLRRFNLSLWSVPDQIKITESYEFRNSTFHKKGTSTWALNVEGTKGQQRISRPYGAGANEWHGAVDFLKARLPRIWYFPNFLFELPEKFCIAGPENGEEGESSESDKDRFYIRIFDNLFTQTVTGSSLETVITRARSTNRSDRRNLDALMLAVSEAVTRIVFEGWNRIFGRTAPTAQEVHIDVDTGAAGEVYLTLRIKGPDGYYELSERSLGFRWFFTFLLMTSFQGNVNENSKPLLLLDEPASNLHSSAQAELLKSFENLAAKCNVVYATHSHHLINLRWLESAYVVKNSALGSFEMPEYLNIRMGARTSITAMKYREFVNAHPDQVSYIQPVLDVMDYRPSELEPIPKVVLVEGKSDFYLLRYLTEVLEFKPEMRTVPGGGAGSLDTLIRLHIGWGKSFAILLDGDQEGRKQQIRYIQEFGPMITGRCVLLPDMCNDQSVSEIEDLLTDTDKAKMMKAVANGGAVRDAGKKLLHRAIIELYARKKQVTLGQASKSRVKMLIDSLTSLLDDGRI